MRRETRPEVEIAEARFDDFNPLPWAVALAVFVGAAAGLLATALGLC